MINVLQWKNKRIVLITGLLLIGLFITACQGNDQNDANEDSAMPQAPIEVTFSTNPDSGIQVGEAVELIAEVTQEGEVVEDADLVRFEIWHEDDEQEESEDHDHNGEEENHEESAEDAHHHDHGDEDGHHHDHGDENGHDHGHGAMEDHDTEHEMIEAEHAGAGQYVLEYTFEQTGMYYVMYHVDARGFHAMTDHEVIVEE